MRRFLIGHLVALLGMTAIAAHIQGERVDAGRRPLVWSTSPNPARTAEMEAFNRQNPDLRVVQDHAAYDIRRIVLQCSSGVGPDLFEAWTGQYLQQAVETGIALELDEYVERFDLGQTRELPAYLEEEVTYRGRRYGSPLSIQADLLIYNERIFDRFGVPYPESGMTWEEFIQMSKRVTYLPDDPAQAVYAVVYMRWEYLFYGMKGEFFSEDGTRVEIEAEPMRRAVQIYRDMIQKHRITLPMEAVGTLAAQGGSGGGEFGGGYRQLFADGRFAMVFRPKSILVHLRYALENQKRAYEEWLADPDRREEDRPQVLELGTAVPPRFADREPAYWARARSVLVNRFGPNPEQALRFLAYLRSPEYSRAVNENYDYLPPEPAYIDLGVGQGYPELDELGAHENSKRALEFGHITRKSPFLQDLEVKRAVDDQIERLMADPGLTVEAVLADARRELETVMQQRLRRDPDLLQLYRSRIARRRAAR